MQSPARRYPDWKAPAEDGTILIWPDASAIASQTLENHKDLAAVETRISGLPLREIGRDGCEGKFPNLIRNDVNRQAGC